jgi:hypothetical protein
MYLATFFNTLFTALFDPLLDSLLNVPQLLRLNMALIIGYTPKSIRPTVMLTYKKSKATW